MSRIEHNVVLEKPHEVVFAYLADPETYPQWQGGCQEVQIMSDRPIGVGTIFRAVCELAGRSVEVQNEVTAYVPDERFTFRSISGNTPYSCDIRVRPFRQGSELRVVLEAQLGSFFRLAEPLAAQLIRQQHQTDLEALIRLLQDAAGGNT